MTKEDDVFDCYCFQAVDDDALDELIRDLTEIALVSGGFVAFFGPDGEGDGAGQATPPGAGQATPPGRRPPAAGV
jgi:hypothetical protein